MPADHQLNTDTESARCPTDNADDLPWVVGVDGTAEELAGLCTAGLLAPFTATAYYASHTVPSVAARTAALRSVLPPSGIIAEGAAAWAHGLGTTTWLHGITVYTPARYRGPRHPAVTYRTVDVPIHHVRLLHNVPVTTETRTAADLARYADTLHELRLLYQLLEYYVPPPLVLQLLNHYLGGRNGITRARTRIARAHKAIRPSAPIRSRLVGKSVTDDHLAG